MDSQREARPVLLHQFQAQLDGRSRVSWVSMSSSKPPIGPPSSVRPADACFRVFGPKGTPVTPVLDVGSTGRGIHDLDAGELASRRGCGAVPLAALRLGLGHLARSRTSSSAVPRELQLSPTRSRTLGAMEGSIDQQG